MADVAAPPADGGGADGGALSASMLGTDELRCVFEALATTRAPENDIGRCVNGLSCGIRCGLDGGVSSALPGSIPAMQY